MTQSRDWMQELILVKNLVRAGVSPEEAAQAAPLMKKVNCSPDEEAAQAAPLMKKVNCSPDEEALVRRVWQQVRSQ